MKHKRFLAILLAVVMLFGMIPPDVFAALPPAEESIPVPVAPTESPPEIGEELPVEESEPETEIPSEEPSTEVTEAPTEAPTEIPVPTETEPAFSEDTTATSEPEITEATEVTEPTELTESEETSEPEAPTEEVAPTEPIPTEAVTEPTIDPIPESALPEETTPPETIPTEPNPLLMEDGSLFELPEDISELNEARYNYMVANGISELADGTPLSEVREATTSRTYIYTDTSYSLTYSPWWDPSLVIKPTNKIWAIHRIDGKVAYCIEPGTDFGTGKHYGSNADNGEYWNSIPRSMKLGIRLALLYGAPNGYAGGKTPKGYAEEMATGIILWEFLCNYRSTVTPFNCTDSRFMERYCYQSSKLGYTDTDGSYKTIDRAYLKQVYDDISAKLASHYTTITFANADKLKAPTYTMERQSDGTYYLELTDTNGILDKYTFTNTSNLTFVKSGNKLKITAKEPFTSYTVTTSKVVPNPDTMGLLCWYSEKTEKTSKQVILQLVSATEDPLPAYFKLTAPSANSLTLSKVSADGGPVEGFCFKIYSYQGNKSFYGKSDASGNVYITDANYQQVGSTKEYAFTGEQIKDGKYAFLETLSVHGENEYWPTSWRIIVYDADGKVTQDKTYTEFTNQNGDCKLQDVTIEGLGNGGSVKMFITNRTLPQRWKLTVTKRPNNPALAREYDLSVDGAQYTISKDGVPLKTYTIAGGTFITDEMPLGTGYTMQETKAPPGFELDPTVYNLDEYSQAHSDEPGEVLIREMDVTDTVISNNMTISKVSAEGGSVEGFCFKIYSYEGHKTFYGKTDAEGKVYITDSDYNQLEEEKDYTFSSNGLIDGKYSFLEVLSQHGENQYWPESWQIIVYDKNGNVVQDETYTDEDFTNQDGDCKLTNVEIKGLGNGGSIKMIITNRLLKANFDIQKYILNPITQTRTKEAGAEFTYYDASYSSYEETPEKSRGIMTTDENGKATSKDLPLGTYRVEQTKTALGTKAVEPFEVELTEAGATYSYNLDNPLWIASVELYKVAEDTQQPLKGAIFGLYDEDDNALEEKTTGTNGKITFDTLLVYGESYYIQEIAAPEGFERDDTKYPVSCTNPDQVVKLTCENVRKARFSIQKYILNPVSQERTKEADAEFAYYDISYGSYEDAPEDSRGVMTTNKNGKATSKYLSVGTYLVEQTKTSPGTDAVEPFEVELTEAGADLTFELDNPLWTASVELYKVEKGTQKPLKDAAFGLFNSENDLLETKVTGEDGKINFDTLLVYGETYYIQEAEAPLGYELDLTMYPVTCTEPNQKVEITCENVPYAYFSIQKYILDPTTQDRTEEADAEFTYYDVSYGSYENAPEESRGVMTTDENGQATSKELPLATYLVEQTKTVPGTDAVEPFEVELTEAGANLTFELDNPLWTAEVDIYKVDQETEEPLKDAVFGLYDAEDNLLEQVTTQEDGTAIFETLLVYGNSYYVQEIEAPPGYEKDPNKYPVSCTQREQKVSVYFTNEGIPGVIEVTKTTTDSSSVEGYLATVTQSKENGTDSNSVFLRSQEDGTFALSSQETPYDFLLDDEGNPVTSFTGFTNGGNYTFTEEIQLLAGTDKAAYIPTAFTFTLTKADGTPGSITYKDTVYEGTLTLTGEDILTDEEIGNYYVTGLAFDGLDYGGKLDVSIQNEIVAGKIEILKVDPANKPLAGAIFLLEWSEDGSNWNPVTFNETDAIIMGGCHSEGLVDGCLTTGEDGYAIFEGLHTNCQYRLSEIYAPNGYQLLADYAYVGTLPEENAYTLPLIVVNRPAYNLPGTGAPGETHLFPVFGITLAATAAFVLFLLLTGSKKKTVILNYRSKR